MTRSLVAVIVMATFTACVGSGGKAATSVSSTVGSPRRGGTVIVGSFGEPQCADWYSCGGLGGLQIMGLQTLPSPMVFVDGQYRPTPMLAGEPSVEPGPPQRVTYRINPQAVWSDGMPITSADFKYSWEQGKATNFPGMSDIAAVDDSAPEAAVVTWKVPSASWRDRFSPILPKHLLMGKDRNAEMKDGYRFSGGPWMIDHWTRGQEIKLVRNPRYWARPANLDAVVFRIITDSTAFLQAYKTGQVDMILAAAAEPGSLELKNLPDTGFEVSGNPGYSFFAFNTQKPPLDRKAVRQALAYAIDRGAIVTQLQGQIRPDARPAQALMSADNREWYSEPFAQYRRDLTKVADLMRADGWSKGPDGVWARGDVRAKVELSVLAGVGFFDLIVHIAQSQWKEAGFDVTIRSVGGAALNDSVPKGNYQALFTGIKPLSTDPEQCSRVCTRSIPTEANGFQGSNISRISSPALDDAWGRVDTELDTAKRRRLVWLGQQTLAEDVPALPLSSTLDVYVFNNTKVGGPVTSSPPYVRLSEWFCKATCA